MRGVIVAWCLRPCYSVSRKNCYLVSAGDLHNRYSHLEDTSKRMTPGLLIGCHVDTSTGLLSFTVNGREAANKFQVSSSSSSSLSSSSSSPSSSSSSLSFTVRHPPSPSVAVRHPPSPSVTVRHRPSPSVAVRRRPSPPVAVRHRPSPSVILCHRPSPSVAVRRRPSPSVAVRHPPPSSVTVRHPISRNDTWQVLLPIDVSATFSQVEPGAMLFPAVFFEPTNKEILQLELGRSKVSDPIFPLEHYLPTWQHLFGFIPFKKKIIFHTFSRTTRFHNAMSLLLRQRWCIWPHYKLV